MKLFNFFKPKTIIFFTGFCLLIILFFLNFSFAEERKVELEITPDTARELETKLGIMSLGWPDSTGPNSTLEFTGEEISLLLEQALSLMPNISFEEPRIMFEDKMVKGSIIIKEPIKGVMPSGGILYIEGFLKRKDEISIDFQVKEIQFNKIELKGSLRAYAEKEINRFFNTGLSQLSGFRIDKLDVVNSKLYFEGLFSGFPSKGDDVGIFQGF